MDAAFKVAIHHREALCHNEVPAIEGLVKNYGRRGVFVQTHFSAIKPGQRIELQLFPRDPQLAPISRLMVVVVHMGRYGFGAAVSEAHLANYSSLLSGALLSGFVTSDL